MGLKAGTEVVPLLSVREFPKVLGTIVAVRCAADFRYDQAVVAGLASWLEINADKAPAWSPTPPLLQQWDLGGVTSIRDRC